MIKIDWRLLIYNHVWFGYYLDTHDAADEWEWGGWRPMDWADRLWPMRRYGVPFPHWWFILWRIELERDKNGKLIND